MYLFILFFFRPDFRVRWSFHFVVQEFRLNIFTLTIYLSHKSDVCFELILVVSTNLETLIHWCAHAIRRACIMIARESP
jgi:hypothetical protein